MEFPQLKIIKKKFKCNEYTVSQLVYHYLFEGLANRDLDREILNVDPKHTKGFSSFSILRNLGLHKDHKGIFNNIDINSAIDMLFKINTDSHLLIAEYLKQYDCDNKLYDCEMFNSQFSEEIKKSREDSKEKRLERLNKCRNKIPDQVNIRSKVYKRNADVVAETLEAAKGNCQLCGKPAPFNKNNGEPYLECHHIKWLSKGGEDTIYNTVALCPNCHKKMHVLNLEKDQLKLQSMLSSLSLL